MDECKWKENTSEQKVKHKTTNPACKKTPLFGSSEEDLACFSQMNKVFKCCKSDNCKCC